MRAFWGSVSGQFVVALAVAIAIINVAWLINPPFDYKHPPRDQRGQQAQKDKSGAGNAGEPRRPVQIECDPNCTSKQPEQGRHEDRFSRLIDKLFDDPIALLTVVLTIANGLLVVVGLRQARLMRNTVDHIPRVERAYVFSGARATGEGTQFRVTISNYGKTPVFIGTVGMGIRSMDQLSKELPADWNGFFDHIGYRGYALPPQDDPEKPFFAPHDVRNWNGLDDRSIVYGRVWYRDIFGRHHSSGFALRIVALGDTRAIPGYDAYWEDRPENDLGPAASGA